MHCGTLTGYRHGCRCDDCKQAKRENMREYRKRKNIEPKEWYGISVKVDARRLAALLSVDERTDDDFCADSGVPVTTLRRVLDTGSASESTLDKIACALGCHMSALEA